MNDLAVVNPFQAAAASSPGSSNAVAQTESNRAIAEVQAAMMIARSNPRNMVAAMDRTDVGPVSDKALLLTKKLSAVIGLAREHKSIKWVLSRAGDLKLPFTQSVESRAPTGNVMIDNFVMIRKVSWDEMWHIVYKAGKRETYQRVSQEDARKFEAALPFRKGGHSGA